MTLIGRIASIAHHRQHHAESKPKPYHGLHGITLISTDQKALLFNFGDFWQSWQFWQFLEPVGRLRYT
jgi:hypothetical protein